MPAFNDDIFIWLSNADPAVLEHCGQDTQRRYRKLGIAILIPAFTALLSMYVAAPYIGIESMLERLIAALFYALIILAIDMGIVATLQKPEDWQSWGGVGYAVTTAIRFIMAVILGIVISHPLLLKVFEGDIETEIRLMRTAETTSILSANQDTIASWSSQANDKIHEIEQDIECNRKLQQYESNGIAKELSCGSSSGVFGDKGRVLRIQEIINGLVKEKDSVRTVITTLSTMQNSKIQATCDSILNRKGNNYLERINALEIVSQKSNSKKIFWATALLMLVLIILDVTAIIIKVCMPRADYDQVIMMVWRFRSTILTNEYNQREQNFLHANANLSSYKQSLVNSLLGNTNKPLEEVIEFIRDILAMSIMPNIGTNLGQTLIEENNNDFNNKEIISMCLLGILVTAILGLILYYFQLIDGEEIYKALLAATPAFMIFLFQAIKKRNNG